MATSAIHFEAHPPERKRRSQSVVVACGCCCCCCCCLHTIGGVIGAAIAPAFGRRAYPSRYRLLVEEYEYDKASSGAGHWGLSAVAVYWLLLLGLSVLAVALGVLYGIKEKVPMESDLLITLICLVLGLPVLQMVSSVGTALVMVVSPRTDKKEQLIQVPKMTLGMVAGTVLGILSMVGLGLLFSMIK